jgi:hypothetical protein
MRYFLPILPAFALIVTQEIFTNNLLRKLKKASIFILVSLSILQYAFINYGWMLRASSKEDYFDQGILTVKKDAYLPVSRELLEVFRNEKIYSSREYINAVFLFNIDRIHCPLQINMLLYNLPFIIKCFMEGNMSDVSRYDHVDWPDKILSADYVVDKTGHRAAEDRSIQADYSQHIEKTLRDAFAKYRDKFRMIAEIKVFDGSVVYVYKRTDGNK